MLVAGCDFAYKKRYESLGKTFNPVKFDPVKWAKAARNAGMKYVVFTTKHHDGFCMFDTKFTDYKITGKIAVNEVLALALALTLTLFFELLTFERCNLLNEPAINFELKIYLYLS